MAFEFLKSWGKWVFVFVFLVISTRAEAVTDWGALCRQAGQTIAALFGFSSRGGDAPYPPSPFWTLSSRAIDPLIRGGTLFTTTLNDAPNGSGFEVGQLRNLARSTPRFLDTLGIRINADGTIEHPDIIGINGRLDLQRAMAEPGTTPIQIRFWADRSRHGADHFEFARHFINGEVPLSLSGVEQGGRSSLFHHDLYTHGLGYALMPPAILERYQDRLRVLLSLYDAFTSNRNFRSELERNIRVEVQNLDEYSTIVASRAAVPPEQRPSNSIGIGLGSRGLFRNRDGARFYPGSVTSAADRRLFDRLCDTARFDSLVFRESDEQIDAFAAQFRR